MERMEKIIIALAWIVPSMILGAILGFVFPFVAYEISPQTGLTGIFSTGPIGLVFGGIIGGFIGAHRASKWKSAGEKQSDETEDEKRT